MNIVGKLEKALARGLDFYQRATKEVGNGGVIEVMSACGKSAFVADATSLGKKEKNFTS